MDNTKREKLVMSCFFELDDVMKYSRVNVQLIFQGNLAEIAGDALYGSELDRCGLFPSWFNSTKSVSMKVGAKEKTVFPGVPLDKLDFSKDLRKLLLDPDDVFKLLFNFTDSTHSSSLISSDPF